MYPRQDLNLHVETDTTPSKWRVYQFHHSGFASAKLRISFELTNYLAFFL